MQTFIEKFIENTKTCPDSAALVSCSGHILSYADVDYCSAKVYSYLKGKGIGKENFVMLCLSHDTAAIVAMLGVWKAGAAFTIVENTRAPERIAFIREDCDCTEVIDDELFQQIQECRPLPDYEKTDSHDACYAIYTSGSTGKPKGIVHEYGKLEQMILASDATMSECPDNDQTRFALVTPLDFAASVTEIVPRLYRKHCLFISPLDTIRNTEAFEQFFLENRITDTAMSASLLKTYKHISPYLKTILVTGEASNRLYLDNVRLINKYAMSESMFTVATFEIDRFYDVTPAGKKSLDSADILILDEDGKLLQDGMIGEICFKNEYFRGYLNMPEQTARATDGGVFHSGDMGFIDPSGNLVVSGRKDDMIKINGNRIEPAEIEAAVKNILGIETAVAKAFSDSERAYIALYYLNSEARNIFDSMDMDCLRAELSKSLPSYMIPTYFIGLDELPLNANGKLSKKELPEPNLNAMRTDYVAPGSAVERLLCEKMEKVLGLTQIGINDDFFLLGGDSLRTIDLINECAGLRLKSADIYRLRTPAKIAEFFGLLSEAPEEDLDEANSRAMQREQDLLPEQINIIDQQFFRAKSDMWNIPILIKLKPETDVERFKQAVMRALSGHPSFGTKIRFTVEGLFKQYYDPACYYDIPVTEVSDADFNVIIENAIQPFELCNAPLYRAVIYKTQSCSYLFMDIHHLICDGTSVTTLMKDIRRCYDDENFVLPPDHYYLYVQSFTERHEKHLDLDEKQKYDALYSKYSCLDNQRRQIRTDRQGVEYIAGDIGYDIDIRKSPSIGNPFFLTAAALATAKYNGEKLAVLKWTYNNRDSSDKFNMTGLLYCNLPIIMEIRNDSTPEELLADVQSQVDFSIANNSYPFTFKHNKAFETAPCILYQLNTASFDSLNGLIDEGRVLFGKIKYADVMFVLNILEDSNSDRLKAAYHYSASHYDRSSVERFHKLFMESAHYLLGDR